MGLADIRATRRQSEPLDDSALGTEQALAADRAVGRRLERAACSRRSSSARRRRGQQSIMPSSSARTSATQGTDTALPTIVGIARPMTAGEASTRRASAGNDAARLRGRASQARFGFVDRRQGARGRSRLGRGGRRRRDISPSRRRDDHARPLPAPARRTRFYLRRRLARCRRSSLRDTLSARATGRRARR